MAKARAEKIHELGTGKSRIISIKINPELLEKIDIEIKKDKTVKSRNDLFTRCALRYLESRGAL